MNQVMTYDRWMKYTYGGRTSRRSAELKAIDKALQTYERTRSPGDREALRRAVDHWIGVKGARWKDSVRNKYHAVDDLYRQVNDLPATVVSGGAEMVALSHVRDESRAILGDLFQGKRMVWKNGILQSLATDRQLVMTTRKVVKKGRQLASAPDAASGAASGGGSGGAANAFTRASGALPHVPAGIDPEARRMATRLVSEVVPAEIMQEVMGELAQVVGDFMTELAASLTPFVGVLTSGLSAVASAGKAVAAENRAYKAEMHQRRSLGAGNPVEAIEAMVRIIDREVNFNAFKASVSAGEFGGKLAGALLDGGTATNAAIGLAGAVVKLTNILRIVVRDVQEKNTATARMQQPIDAGIFEVNPLLGAYFVACVPTSVMMNTVFERWGQHGWRGDAERTAARHIDPLKKEAAKLIKAHRFEIKELARFPGVLAVNEQKLEQMRQRVGRTGMVGFGSGSV